MSTATRTLKVVVLDDEPADHALISEALTGSNIVIDGRFAALTSLLKALRDEAGEPDAVLADLNLPDSQGINTVEVLRSAHPTIPIVVITGDRTAAAGALRAGADEVVTKDDLMGGLSRAVADSRARNDGRGGARIRGFYMADAPLVVVDREDEVVLANASAQALLDRPPEVGRAFTLMFVPEDRMEVATFLASLWHGKGQRVWCVARMIVTQGIREVVLTGVYDEVANAAHVTLRPAA